MGLPWHDMEVLEPGPWFVTWLGPNVTTLVILMMRTAVFLLPAVALPK